VARRFVRHDNGELFAAIAGRQIDIAALSGDRLSHLLEHTVAHVMAERIVDSFEMVDIRHDQRHLAAVPLHAGPFSL